jgi:hypothetical protein
LAPIHRDRIAEDVFRVVVIPHFFNRGEDRVWRAVRHAKQLVAMNRRPRTRYPLTDLKSNVISLRALHSSPGKPATIECPKCLAVQLMDMDDLKALHWLQESTPIVLHIGIRRSPQAS